jgi:hypothetical protein
MGASINFHVPNELPRYVGLRCASSNGANLSNCGGFLIAFSDVKALTFLAVIPAFAGMTTMRQGVLSWQTLSAKTKGSLS